MDKLKNKKFILFISTIIFLYSIQGCKSTQQISKKAKNKSIEFIDAATYPFPKQKVVDAIHQTLIDQKYVVSQIESNDTVVIADRWSDEQLIEEHKEIADKQDHTTLLSGLLTFLGIIFFVGLVAASLSSSHVESDDSSSQISIEDNGKTIYNYRVFMDVKAINDSTTDVMIDILKTKYENDQETESVYLENKYLNHALIDGIDSCLRK
ncbi:MAG: hypothetical protein HY964_08145 [Ignavibacteriales bacterium]|nr:hypothetical protein [Ignavibacteriales bacterium]